jgi:hypothetical protein
MSNLSKINWESAPKIEWQNRQFVVLFYAHRNDSVVIRNDNIGSVARRNCNGIWNVTNLIYEATFKELDELRFICEIVDGFITHESKPWRTCTLEEALENINESEWKLCEFRCWFPMNSRCGDGNPDDYSYRTLAPRTLAPPNRRNWLDRTGHRI